jgi:hypothetical protein
MDGFTRQETLALTQTTSSRLAYLDRTQRDGAAKVRQLPKSLP